MNATCKILMCQLYDFTLAAENHYALCRKAAGLKQLMYTAEEEYELREYEAQVQEAMKLAAPYYNLMCKIHPRISAFIDFLEEQKPEDNMMSKNAMAYHMLLNAQKQSQN